MHDSPSVTTTSYHATLPNARFFHPSRLFSIARPLLCHDSAMEIATGIAPHDYASVVVGLVAPIYDTCYLFDCTCTREPPVDPEKASDEPTPERLILESEPEPQQPPPATAVLLESRRRHLLIAASGASHFFPPSDRLNRAACTPARWVCAPAPRRRCALVAASSSALLLCTLHC